IVYLDALMVKVKDNGHIIYKAVYVAIGVNLEGKKELLGIWIAKTEGAKFWLKVVTELKNRGVNDIFIACVDGLKGFPEAIESVFPKTQVQLCIVHLVRYSLKFVPWKDRKEVAADLKSIYTSANVESAKQALDAFGRKWDGKYPTISESWRRNWQGVIPFLAYPDYIRKAIYTTNAIESIQRGFRKITKNRGAFPNDDAVVKLLYLALQNMEKKWTMPIRQWTMALNQFAILFGDRLPRHG
ncbi:MAG: IS256 family transposase, partial [bacterium]